MGASQWKVESAFGGAERAWGVGYGYRLGQALDLSVEATRREAANDDAPEHGVMLRLGARWQGGGAWDGAHPAMARSGGGCDDRPALTRGRQPGAGRLLAGNRWLGSRPFAVGSAACASRWAARFAAMPDV